MNKKPPSCRKSAFVTPLSNIGMNLNAIGVSAILKCNNILAKYDMLCEIRPFIRKRAVVTFPLIDVITTNIWAKYDMLCEIRP